jgi:hypothetical protein
LGTFVSDDRKYTVYDTANCEPTELWVGVVGQNILSRESRATVPWLYGQWETEYAMTVEEAYDLIVRQQQLAAEFS